MQRERRIAPRVIYKAILRINVSLNAAVTQDPRALYVRFIAIGSQRRESHPLWRV